MKTEIAKIIAGCMILAFTGGCSKHADKRDTQHETNEDKTAFTDAGPFSDLQRQKLENALVIVNNAVKDELFEKVILAQDAAGVFQWDEGRLSEIPATSRAHPVQYFLGELNTRGLPAMSQFRLGKFRRISTTGGTTPCDEYIYFNGNNLDQNYRTPTYVAGTILHERLHSLCFKHYSNDGTIQKNLCDFAYQCGHLAVTIALYRENGSNPIPKPLDYMCKSLVERLQTMGIIEK